jgi:MFS family permease
VYIRLDRAHRAVAVVLGIVTLASVAVVFVWNVVPQFFPARTYDFVGAFSLAMIAVAYLVYQAAHRPPAREFAKAVMLAVAFLFWAGNQFWPNARCAVLLNDVAIALFVLDVFLVIIGWPPTSPDESFAEDLYRIARAQSVTLAC